MGMIEWDYEWEKVSRELHEEYISDPVKWRLEMMKWYDEDHLCIRCKKCPIDIGETTQDAHPCDFAYNEDWKTKDNGMGYWVTGCKYYEPIDTRSLYGQWMQSDRWKEITAKKKKDAGYQCEMCGSAKNLCVHHTTYDHVGWEKNHLDELVVLCSVCHKKIHEHDIEEK